MMYQPVSALALNRSEGKVACEIPTLASLGSGPMRHCRPTKPDAPATSHLILPQIRPEIRESIRESTAQIPAAAGIQMAGVKMAGVWRAEVGTYAIMG
jgi:hypothetical protein